jgi:hypothetical protein
VFPARGAPTNIIIGGADDTTTLSVVASSELNTLISDVEDRFILQKTNSNLDYLLPTIANELMLLLDGIGDRFVIKHADSNILLSNLYPITLIGDSTPPLLSGISVKNSGYGIVQITWTSDEFAASVVDYGTQSGSYPQKVIDEYYRKNHEVTLNGLTIGEKYYYRITNTDRSGNSTQTQESSFTVNRPIFLPLVVSK